MSGAPDPAVDLEANGQQVALLFQRAALLSDQDTPPAEYYPEILHILLTLLDAPAGAIWLRDRQGQLELKQQVNIEQVGLNWSANSLQSHEALLCQVCERTQAHCLPPQSSLGTQETASQAANPTDYPVLLGPILVDQQAVGILEVWEPPDFNARAVADFMSRLLALADLVSRYLRNQERRQLAGQQEIWTRLEAFAQEVHTSLNPTEVAYRIANEGRKLVGCDRISVAVRSGRQPVIEGVTGAEKVERRSNLMRRLQALSGRVMDWGERLVYQGVKDDSLPPGVLQELDAYLAESNSKLLVVLPLRDKRESDLKQPPRSALVMECFEPAVPTEQLLARLEIVGKHAASALYNSAEHRDIPFGWLWQPVARLQKGLGGKTRTIVISAAIALVVLVAALVWVPYPLKMDAKGQLVPEERSWTFSPVEGHIVAFAPGLQPGSAVALGQHLLLMHNATLEIRIVQLRSEIAGAEHDIAALTAQYNAALTEADRLRISGERKQKEFLRDRKNRELRALADRTDTDPARPGHFWLRSPMAGTILNSDFRENLLNRQVKASDPLLRIGDKSQRWEIELKIPHAHIGKVLQAFDPDDPEAELEVDLLLLTEPTRTFKGKLARDKVGGEAAANKDDPTNAEPILLVIVRIEGPDIDPEDQIPRALFVPGTEVHAKVRCGRCRLGYSLFYGVWEFFYEKVLFLF